MLNSAKSCCCLLVWGTCVLLSSAMCQGQDLPEAPKKLVAGPIAKLAPMLGDWEIDAVWKNGSSLWARNEYRIGVGGRFVEARTYAKDESNAAYQRYLTVFGYDESSKEYKSWGFTFDGTEKTVPITIEESGGKMTLTSEWSPGGETRIRQTVSITQGEDHYDWNVWQQSGSEDWIEIMDGRWKRVR